MHNKYTPSDVTVISVCYKSEAVIDQMIASVPHEAPIILVDNGRTNQFPAFSPSRKISVVSLDKNLGFGVGCNRGANFASTTWLLFLNPDSVLHPGALNELIVAAEEYRSASAFNPRIENADGSAYFKRRSWLISRKHYMPKGWPASDCIVPVLSGAAIFVSKELFLKVGGFDPNIFLYHEDDDLSLRLAEHGPLMFIRESLVTHASGNSTVRSSSVARFKAFHMARSRIYTGKKHNVPYPIISTLFQAFLLVMSPLALFSARRRAKAVGFFLGCIRHKGIDEPFK